MVPEHNGAGVRPVACVALQEGQGGGVGDRGADGSNQGLGQPGDDGEGVRSGGVGEVVSRLDGSHNEPVLGGEIRVRGALGARDLRPSTRGRQARRPRARGASSGGGGLRRPGTSGGTRAVTGPGTGTWGHEVTRSLVTGEEIPVPNVRAEDGTGVKAAAVARLLLASLHRRGSVGLGRETRRPSGRSEGGPVPDGSRGGSPSPWRRVPRGPVATARVCNGSV